MRTRIHRERRDGSRRAVYRRRSSRRIAGPSRVRLFAWIYSRRLGGLVPGRPLGARRSDRALQHWIRRPSALPQAVGLHRRRLQSAARRGRARFCGRRRRHVSVCLGADDAGHGGARGDSSRGARKPARRLPLSRHVARRHRLPDGGVSRPRVDLRIGIVPDIVIGQRRIGADA